MDHPRQPPRDLDACHERIGQLEAQQALSDAERAQWQTQHASLAGQLDEQRRTVDEQQRRLDEQQRVLDETAQAYDALQQERDVLKEELERFRRWVYGPRRERIVEGEGQKHLFDLGEAAPPVPEVDDEPPADETPSRRRRRRRRKLDLDRLPQRRIEHEVPEHEKTCGGCGREMAKIGEDESRVLNYQPAVFEVEVHVLPKYACSCCGKGVVSPPVPPKPIGRSMAGAGLISFVLVSKFGDHLPLYRLEDVCVRHGLYLPRSTLCDWVHSAAKLLEPLAEVQRKLLLRSQILWTDDTTVRMLDAQADGGSRTAYFWAYLGDEDFPYTVYNFTTNHQRIGPETFLSGWSGYLQADAYSGYEGIALESDGGILHVACGAHIRRKFVDARSHKPVQAAQMLEWFRQLYDIEDRAHDFTPAERQALRQLEAVPVLAKMQDYLQTLVVKVLPKSPLGQAVRYALNRWEAFGRYTTDGRLSIDNNVSERTLRAQAIGRKNWLFLGHENAGPRAATIYTVLAGAKRHRLEPWAYLTDVLLRLTDDTPDLEALLPDRWAEAHPQHVLTHRLEEARDKRARQQTRRAARRRP
jgi:transposase